MSSTQGSTLWPQGALLRWLGEPLTGPLTSGSFSISCALSPLVRFHSLRAPLAQLAEQLTLNQRVRGSSPRGLTRSRSGITEIVRFHRIVLSNPPTERDFTSVLLYGLGSIYPRRWSASRRASLCIGRSGKLRQRPDATRFSARISRSWIFPTRRPSGSNERPISEDTSRSGEKQPRCWATS